MTRRLAAALAWLALVVLWLAATALTALAWLVVSERKRWRRKVARWFSWPPRYGRVLALVPGGRPEPYATSEPCRMSPTEVAEKRGLLWQRDGGWCQECDRMLSLDVHHSADEHPEVHHLIAWSRCKYEQWANALWNLCLLCGPCNRRIRAGATWRLRRFSAELRRTYQIDQPGRAA